MDSEQRKQLVVIDYAFLGIVWVVVPLRLFVRRCIIHNVGKDDWLMAVLLVSLEYTCPTWLENLSSWRANTGILLLTDSRADTILGLYNQHANRHSARDRSPSSRADRLAMA